MVSRIIPPFMREPGRPLKLSVVIPCLNAAATIGAQLDALAGQSWPGDWEVIVADNGSTDGSREIARSYQGRLPGLKLVDASDRRGQAHARNLGAAPNYNIVLANARGRYFKWLAHDDRMLPSYVAKTTRVLDERTDAVLCNSVVAYIDGEGQPIGLYNTRLSQADAPSPSVRFAWLVLRSHSCVDFFGMWRRSALEGSLQHGSFHGADRALLAQMALRGRLIQLPAPLVQMREHENRYTRLRQGKDTRAVWHDARLHGLRGRVNFPTWRLYLEYLKMVASARLTHDERMRCYATLGGWWVHNWNAARAVVDVIAVVAPGVPGVAERLKARLFGAAPGHLADLPRR